MESIFIYRVNAGWGFPGSQLLFFCMDMENVDFTLCYNVLCFSLKVFDQPKFQCRRG